MTLRDLPRVVLMPAIRPVRLPHLHRCWAPDQLIRFLAAADGLGLGFDSFSSRGASAPGSSRAVLVFDAWDIDFLRHAWPVLQDLEGNCGVVLQTAAVGQRRRQRFGGSTLTPAWAELRPLVRLGVDVVSSGHEGYDLTGLESEVVFGELLRSRCEIERRLDITPRAIRYSFGRVNAQVAAAARDAGFEFGISPRGSLEGDAHRCPVLRPRPLELPAQFASRVLRSVREVRSPGELVAQAGAH